MKFDLINITKPYCEVYSFCFIGIIYFQLLNFRIDLYTFNDNNIKCFVNINSLVTVKYFVDFVRPAKLNWI